MKTKLDKKVNNRVKNLNKRLKKTYHGRYYIKQIRKTMPWAQARNLPFYVYAIIDTQERVFNISAYIETDIFVLGKIEHDVNNFIRQQKGVFHADRTYF